MEGESDEDTSFLRTDDLLSLSCVIHNASGNSQRVSLAAQGFGNRMCYLENLSNKDVPPDFSVCKFVLEKALSVRALQEMVSSKSNVDSGQSGHKTLLYGHAILLRHHASSMYLTCLTTSSSRDKLAFDVGLEEQPQGESCWWTVHPASKTRSDGEKVRIGDDFILVSVSSERYLHFSPEDNGVLASFRQTLWTIIPVSSGAIRQKNLSCVFGGDVLRFTHGDECLTICQEESEAPTDLPKVMYETGDAKSQARSLWRVEHVKIRWTGGLFSWSCKVRIRHVTSGRYLGVTDSNLLTTVPVEQASEEVTAFCLMQTKDDKMSKEEREEEGMGAADVKYDDTYSFLQHIASGLWLSYKTYETKKRGIGRVEEKQAVLLAEGHMDDAFTFAKSQDEDSKSAVAIRRCAAFFHNLLKALDGLLAEGVQSAAWQATNIDEVQRSLKDLIDFFEFPDESEEHEMRVMKLKGLKNRQGLFQEEGMISLVLDTIDKFSSTFKSSRDFAAICGEDRSGCYNTISNYLYLLLAALIRGNRPNCAQFAQTQRLNWLFSRLEGQEAAQGVLDVLFSVLTHSPEALNMIRENHIQTIVGLLDRQGRDSKILEVLCSLCVSGSQGAVRLNQNLISNTLLPDRDLLLQTRLVDHVRCFRPNVSVKIADGVAMYSRWCFEVVVDSIEQKTDSPTHLRIGWANADGFLPYPARGTNWGCNGLGDDIYSFAFDGNHLWTNQSSQPVQPVPLQLKKGDVIGSAIDLSIPRITFSVNGQTVRGFFKDFDKWGTFYPCVSLGAKVSVRFLFGGSHGRLKFGPLDTFSPISDAILPGRKLRIEPCFNFGFIEKSIYQGPIDVGPYNNFKPSPIDCAAMQAPAAVDQIRERLAENLHEIWVMKKIEQGWTFGEQRSDEYKTNPCLTTFSQLPDYERTYNLSLAQETLKVIFILGYNIVPDPQKETRVKTVKLGNSFVQPNGYKPMPIDLSQYALSPALEELADYLAENTHNLWGRDRIAQGWTWGIEEDPVLKRSPFLVPFKHVDPAIQAVNRASSSEIIRTILAFGYDIERSSSSDVREELIMQRMLEPCHSDISRTYRVETTWAVSQGKWYFEFEVMSEGNIRVGFMQADSRAGVLVGDSIGSYAFDCCSARKWHVESDRFGKRCHQGDVVGCLIDLDDSTIYFSLNGELMMDSVGQEIAFKGIQVNAKTGYVPAFSLGVGQSAKLNLGQDVKSFKYFTCCGLQEGFEPFCVNMHSALPMWYDRLETSFETISEESSHSHILAQRSAGGTPLISISTKYVPSAQEDHLEVVRLSLPVRCHQQFTSRSLAQRRAEVDNFRKKLDPRLQQRGGGEGGGPTSLMVPKGAADGQHLPSTTAAAAAATGGAKKKTKIANFFKKQKSHGGADDVSQSAVTAILTPDASADAGLFGKFGGEDTDHLQYEMQVRENAVAEYIDEYHYSVRLLPGQDPACSWVGWLTPYFKLPTHDVESVFASWVDVCLLDDDYQPRSEDQQRTVYMVNAGDLLAKFGSQEDVSKRLSQGLTIGCFLDAAGGSLSFEMNGKPIAARVQVPEASVLYPAVAFKARSCQVASFELGRTRHTLPVVSGMLRRPKLAMPQLPNRLQAQCMSSISWSRVPQSQLRVNILKLSDLRGWSLLCEEPVQMVALKLSEEERSFDILEMEEQPDLLQFHKGTLQLYKAICSHGNRTAAEMLTNHVSADQFNFLTLNLYLSGPLRMAYFDLLIAMHLESYVKLRSLTKNEFVVPLTNDQVFSPGIDEDKFLHDFHEIPGEEGGKCIRTNFSFLVNEDEAHPPALELCPAYPIQGLKDDCIQLFINAAALGGHLRDPVGGSYEYQFVPLLKVINNLLAMGCLSVEEIFRILSAVHPRTFPPELQADRHGDEAVLDFSLSDSTKTQLCKLFHLLCDTQLQHRLETLIAAAKYFVTEAQSHQLKKYLDIKNSSLPSAVAARRTREFRCPPEEQMRSLVHYNRAEYGTFLHCTSRASLKEFLQHYHSTLLSCCGVEPEEEEAATEAGAGKVDEAAGGDAAQSGDSGGGGMLNQLLIKMGRRQAQDLSSLADTPAGPQNLQELICQTIIKWANSETIENLRLLREMFSLLHRQYNALGEIVDALNRAYVINSSSKADVSKLLQALGKVRCLIGVQVSPAEEEMLKASLWDIMNNTVFFQHPDLIRCLSVHETVMQLMVHTLNKSKLAMEVTPAGAAPEEGGSSENMIVMCCRFLCYFCRTGVQNQRAVFEHLSFMVENGSMLLTKASLRGSCPLDVAYSSFMDNNELALALKEAQLERIASYLSRCGVQSNTELLAFGYPDVGWDPVEGERFLDFLRFTVWVNGETVEENASLVVRLLIRRPECLGPALRGGSSGGGSGGGLLKAIQDGIAMSIHIALYRAEDDILAKVIAESEEKILGKMATPETDYDLSRLPADDDEDYIDMGGAVLTFYAVLVDLLGRCAPDPNTTRSDSLRMRAILKSLVSMTDLEGVLSLRFILQPVKVNFQVNEDGEEEYKDETGLPPGLLPEHKASVVLFLERIYGTEDPQTFFRLVKNCFLPDMRDATTMNVPGLAESDLALAINRYICNSVLPLLTRHATFFSCTDVDDSLLYVTLSTAYKLSKTSTLTKNQRDTISEFLVAITSQLNPHIFTKLLDKIVQDIRNLTAQSVVPLRMLTVHYKKFGYYYSSSVRGGRQVATEQEKALTMTLFSEIFDALSDKTYDADLFSQALPCLSSIACALPPDYTCPTGVRNQFASQADPEAGYTEVRSQKVPQNLAGVVNHFVEHWHDSWAMEQIEQGWKYDSVYDEANKTQPNLKPYHTLAEKEQKQLRYSVEQILLASVALNWKISYEDKSQAGSSERRSGMKPLESPHGYNPAPLDLRNITLRGDALTACDRLAQFAHFNELRKKEERYAAIGLNLVPGLIHYDLLTSDEKQRNIQMAQELLKYLQVQGIILQPPPDQKAVHRTESENPAVQSVENRFAFLLLTKLLHYVERAYMSITNLQNGEKFTRTNNYTQASQEIKFFGKVVLPLIEKYFQSNKRYFVEQTSTKEKENTCILFSKLFLLLRSNIQAFGHDVGTCVRCLEGVVQSLDIRAIIKNSPEIARAYILPFFSNCADDLMQLVGHVKKGRFSHIKGTLQRGATSLNYIYMALVPVLKTFFEHVHQNQCGEQLLVGDIQLFCYKILSGLYNIGCFNFSDVKRDYLSSELDRHRPLVGECVAAFANTFPVAFLEPKFNKSNKTSILYNISEDSLENFSLDIREVMTDIVTTLPNLQSIVSEIAKLAETGGNYSEAPHVIELTLPMLCSYLPYWWKRGPDNQTDGGDSQVTEVTSNLMNTVLGSVLNLIKNNMEVEDAPWMTRIAMRTRNIVENATDDMLQQYFLPVAEKLRDEVLKMEEAELQFFVDKRNVSDPTELEEELSAKVQKVVRNMFAFYPLLIRFIDIHRTTWLKAPSLIPERLCHAVADTFFVWARSHYMKREEHSFVSQNEINPLALIMSNTESPNASKMKTDSDQEQNRMTTKKGKKNKMENLNNSLGVACMKRLLPIGLSTLGGREQELVQKTKKKLAAKELEDEVHEYLKAEFENINDQASSPQQRWQKILYQNMGDKSRMAALVERVSRDHLILKVFKMAKVLHGLYMVDHPPQTHKGVWKKLVTSQRKRAVMACFRVLPLHALPRHRVINLFLKAYKRQWLSYEEPPVVKLIEDITSYAAAPGVIEAEEEPEISCTDGLKQLITGLCRSASDQSGDDPLYIAYANIMGMSCSGEDDDDDDGGDGDDGGEGASFEEQEMQKQQLLSEQARLADRGAAEMVLLNIAASNGEDTEVVRATIDLGISILLGGNMDVQRKMLSHLKDKKEVGFFTSLAGLMQQCTVLDLDAFERYKKAQDLGVPIESVVTLQDADFTCKIFRFLQLLCEGHNLAFQDYLRTQAGNTTTVNLIICTVDYLLRLQDSMMDFYWHYSGKDNIETAGKLNFVTGIKVGKQIFCSLTEYIQGPCVGNQLALAHSRLWDAIGGFFYIFAHMQDKLSKQPEQLELMREFMKLKKEMMVMLLSMLEGNVVGGPIGKQMVETLIESSANVEMILKFFEIFLKMKDVTSSEAFLAFDINGDGVISHKEFRHAMMQQKMYSEEEIEYIMNCVDANQDGKVDFNEFTERFHNPAKEIGFNLALLLVNLHEHIPNDPRLERLVGKAQCMLDYFEPYLGRIEILGSSGRIERVYFEVTQSNIDQWEAPQIKESKRSFLYSVINEGGDKEKLESFINFCEDTIFEMQHAQRVSGEGEGLSIRQVAAVKAILEGERVKRVSSALSSARRFASRNFRSLFCGFFAVLRGLTPASLVRGAWRLFLALLTFVFFVVKSSFAYLGRLALALAFAPEDTGLEVQEALQAKQPWLLTEEEQLALERLDPASCAPWTRPRWTSPATCSAETPSSSTGRRPSPRRRS
ncbi:hypothetical protein BOX15_Mlig033273g1 [Macrostomum lignano]|uniref:Ryanodine receptor n=1 Tax=Macrostomum lignano TaxID=282301 RepID=A0A267GJE7_9PLAT|nr:hypothetical protein BOX15_Mlig033273g1 [Macrostomum lignano]